MADVKPDEYIDELQDLSDEDQPLDKYHEVQRKQYEEQERVNAALRTAATAIMGARAALDPMEGVKDLAFTAQRVLDLAQKGDFAKAESALEVVLLLTRGLLSSQAMRDLRDAKKAEDEESSGRPSWTR